MKNETRDDEEPVRLNGKFVWDTAERACDFINVHYDQIHNTTFSEYIVVMKVMMGFKEAHNVEGERVEQQGRREMMMRMNDAKSQGIAKRSIKKTDWTPYLEG